jgi:transcriptional antiterminator Rof (Rho-off)
VVEVSKFISMEPAYQPISCTLYDRLTDIAVVGRRVKLTYLEEGNQKTDLVMIKDLVTQRKEEFLITDQLPPIRLDRILSVREEDQV